MAFRKFKKFIGGEKSPEVYTVTPREGTEIHFGRTERLLYSYLFTIIDFEEKGVLGGKQGAQFLRRSQLPDDQLREVWRWACGGVSKPELKKDDWLVALKLIACAQAGHGCTLDDLLEHQDGLDELADLCYGIEPNIEPSSNPSIAPSSIGISVNNPRISGGGLNKHVSYTVETTTSLPHYPIRLITTTRRYSDFLWLHERLCTVFPDAIIPLFPAKRAFGNLDEEFVQSRANALETYINLVARHPRCGYSLDLIVFLAGSNSGLQAAKDYIKTLSDMQESQSSFLKHGNNTSLIIKADERFVQLCSFHASALDKLSKVAENGDNLASAQYMLSNIVGAAAKEIVRISEAERTGMSALLAAVNAGSKEEVDNSPSSTSDTGNDEAAAAFAAHSRAKQTKATQNEFQSMFATDVTDPFSGSGAPELQSEDDSELSAKQAGITDALVAFGRHLSRVGTRLYDQTSLASQVLYARMREEQNREAELDAANKRRELLLDQAQSAHSTLQRKRNDYASLRQKGDVGAKVVAAEKSLRKTEELSLRRQREAKLVTERLKEEMLRVMRQRRAQVAKCLQEYVIQQAKHAQLRAEAWKECAATLARNSTDIDAATTRVQMYEQEFEERTGTKLPSMKKIQQQSQFEGDVDDIFYSADSA